MKQAAFFLVIFAVAALGGRLLMPDRVRATTSPQTASFPTGHVSDALAGRPAQSARQPEGAWPAISDAMPWRAGELLLPRTAGDEDALNSGSALLNADERIELLRRPPKNWSDLPARFDLSLVAQLPRPQGRRSQPEHGRVTVLFNYQNRRNFYYVEFSPQGTRIGRVEGGLASPLGGSPRGLEPGRQHQLKVKRRELAVLVLIDGKLAGTALDGAFHGGKAAIVRPGPELIVRRLRRQGIEKTGALSFFADDFMRAPDESGQWAAQSGHWQTKSMPSPSMSANAFTYLGSGRHAMTVAGHPFWDGYRLRVSARGPDSGALGVVFAHQDRHRYYLFRWTSRTGIEQRDGRRELVQVEDGKETIVARGRGGYIPGQWYRIEVRLGVGTCTVLIDGHEMLSARAPDLVEGRIGLYADTPPANKMQEPKKSGRNDSLDKVTFDDIVVTDLARYEERFDDDYALRRWQPRGGTWSHVAERVGSETDHRGHVRADFPRGGTQTGRLLFGDTGWGNYRFAVDVLGGKGEAGLVFNYRDELNYYLFSVDLVSGEASLVEVDGGATKLLDRGTVQVKFPLRLEVRTRLGHLLASANPAASLGEHLALEGWDEQLLRGRVGLAAGRARSIDFDNAVFAFETTTKPVISENAVFSREKSMMSWTGDKSEWYAGKNPHEGRQVWWHRARFPGDTTLEARLGYYRSSSADVALSLSKSGDSAGKGSNGYVFSLNLSVSPVAPRNGNGNGNGNGNASYELDLRLQREGKRVQQRTLPVAERPGSLAIRRAGTWIIGYVDGAPQIAYRDPKPLRGSRIAYLSKNVDVPQKSIRITNEHVFNERFNQAPVNWRIAAGYWEMTPRWECDTRWSFYSGRSFQNRTSGRDHLHPAVLWSKRLLEGDVTIEFFVAPLMVKNLGRRYAHARDINVTLSADGQDLTSGYTCSFGAENNKYSAIYRRAKKVETDPGGQIRRSHHIHYVWHYIRVQRVGDTINFEAWECPNYPRKWERTTSISFKDPEPLKGKHLAIWTYGSAIAISRVRISGAQSQQGELESPDLPLPGEVLTFYDRKSD